VPLPHQVPIPLALDEVPSQRARASGQGVLTEPLGGSSLTKGNDLLDAGSILGDPIPEVVSTTLTTASVSSTSVTGVPLPTVIPFPLLLSSDPIEGSAAERTEQHSKRTAGVRGRDLFGDISQQGGNPFSGLSGLLHSLDEEPNRQGQRSVITSNGLIGLSQIADASAKEAAGVP
jgi:hypothetical protein